MTFFTLPYFTDDPDLGDVLRNDNSNFVVKLEGNILSRQNVLVSLRGLYGAQVLRSILSPIPAVACALRRETPIQYPCCRRERIWVVEDLKGRYMKCPD